MDEYWGNDNPITKREWLFTLLYLMICIYLFFVLFTGDFTKDEVSQLSALTFLMTSTMVCWVGVGHNSKLGHVLGLYFASLGGIIMVSQDNVLHNNMMFIGCLIICACDVCLTLFLMDYLNYKRGLGDNIEQK